MAKNMQKLMKQARAMQSRMMAAQEELRKKEFEGVAGGGMVTVRLNGSGEMLSVSLNREAVDPDDVEMLEDLIVAAFQSAHAAIAEQSSAAMGGLTEGMNLPGLM